ncbi:transmembrane 4 L6 family member 1 isoform X2 [Hyla sarda]|uniref:transmembrane 4 L6 family member 1 isoform X2 n=1 Tax=Hyla sarda TaxID=327740 RepID=UPI0024C44208|nr:transmembrane 4 L6 family member 1 isoform X2 [Hyla sarda]
MCFGKCGKCIGSLLLSLALMSIVANILLYFPNGETKYARENNLSRYVWFFEGIAGAGLLMLGSVVAALIGIVGAGYCLIISALGLAEGPYCLNRSDNQWTYPFADSNANYLTDHSTWSQCVEPKNVVVWNVTLFSILLGLSGLEIILCLIQVINGLIGGICGACCCQEKSQQYVC